MSKKVNIHTIVRELVENGCDSSFVKTAESYTYPVDSVVSLLERASNSNCYAGQPFSDLTKVAAVTVKRLSDKINHLEKIAEVKEITHDMLESGIISDSDVMDKVAELLGKSSSELAITREAIKLASSMRLGVGMFEMVSANQHMTTADATKKRGMFDRD